MIFRDNIVWDEFISRHDLIWDIAPTDWYEAPFLGNGFFGATVFFAKDLKKLYINLGHTCVYDNREITELDETLIKKPRLPLGKVCISFGGKILRVKLRLELYNACLRGEIFTNKGRIKFNCLVFNEADCFFLEYNELGEESISFSYEPSHGMSPRYYRKLKYGDELPKNYESPKSPYNEQNDGADVFVQPYFNGGGFAVAHLEYENRFFVGAVYSENENELTASAAGLVKNCLSDAKNLLKSHLDWWSGFYQKSFVSINNGIYEGFLYIQLYKLASASRENGRPFDTSGPWLTDNTGWPGTWWNLNVQLSVSPLYISNHIDIAHCINNTLFKHKADLYNNVPKQYRSDCAAMGRCTTSTLYSPVAEPGNTDMPNGMREAGNLIWTLFYCWQEYKMTCDKTVITDLVYPLLKRAVKYYLYFWYRDEDGKLHIPATVSPEYPDTDSPDTNYDLALLRWGCTTLIELCEEFNFEDATVEDWKFVLENLTDYPQTKEEGLLIAANTHYARSHRHYSHILAFYPLHILDPNTGEERNLIETTINFWQSKSKALQGYSQSGAASMYAMLGNGDKALSHLQKLWRGFIQPNTMYKEGGNPVLETPPSAATAILEMLVQSHEGYINIFPAVPGEWKDICFDGLLCYGGFEVGAKLADGKLEWIKIKSLCGNKCTVKASFSTENLYCDSDYERTDDNKYIFNIKKGQTVIFSAHDTVIKEPVKIKQKTMNCYGLNKRNKSI